MPASALESPSGVRGLLRPYAPINRLLDMGFEQDAARAALALAGGDVDRAARLMVEDSRAHESREVGSWEFESDTGWVPFDMEQEAVLRGAQEKGLSSCELRARGQRYLVDLEALTQTNLSTMRLRRIRRRGSGTASSSKGN